MADWKRFLAIVSGSTATALLFAFAITVALDPFGRLGLSKSHQIGFTEERPSMVTRAIDPRFNSVIVGNSTSMPLMPENLDRLTGLRFVSLSISGSDAPASVTTATFFLTHHPEAEVIVIALLPEIWCSGTYREHRPFPFWLYSSLPRYLWGLAGDISFELIKTKFGPQEDNRIDGYHRYVGPFEQPSYNDVNFVRSRLDGGSRPTKAENATGKFPPIDHLTDVISPRSAPLFILLWTPRYVNYTPALGSAAEASDLACKQFLLERTSGLRNVRILDWSEPQRPENNDPANFFDPIHFRRQLAERIEQDIARVTPVTALKGF